MKEWASGGGNTDLDNLVLICSLHHRTIHERRIVLQRGRDGSIVARHRDGTLMQQAPRLHLGPDLLELLSDNTSAAPAETVPTRRVA
ncbi:HNH endonuclease [Frankia sp. B2]|nr:HNH endonuclease [Frankia sp. B2]